MNKQDLVFWLAENVSTEDFNNLQFTLPDAAIRTCWYKSIKQPGVIRCSGNYGDIDSTDVRLAKVASKHKTSTAVHSWNDASERPGTVKGIIPVGATHVCVENNSQSSLNCEIKKEDDDDKPTALDVQVGADHYKQQKIQPVEYIHANNIGFMEGNVIKYVTRHKLKNGKQDLEKAIHFLQMLIELEYGE